MLTPVVLAFALSAALPQAPAQEIVADILVHGNLLTPADEVRRLAGVEIGTALAPDLLTAIEARLVATRRFRRVEVLKRFASIADPAAIVLVLIVDEGPVRIVPGEGGGAPARVVRRRGLRLMYWPVLSFEDGYGLAYGVRIAHTGSLGRGSRVSFPLTWGGDKQAAAQVDKILVRGPLSRVEAGASLSRRTHPFFETDDGRRRLWVTAERQLTSSLRAAATAGWQRVSLVGNDDAFGQTGGELVFDTRLDPMLARNAIYARAAWTRSDVPPGPVNQTSLDGRGYVGLRGQSVLVLRALREDADGPLPPYLKSMLGGMPNLRGFKRGTALGDTLVAGSVEVRVPLTSPLSAGKFGATAFLDVGRAYDDGQRLADGRTERAIGVGVWLSAAFVRINVAVAHGRNGSTRVHVGTGVSP